MPSDSSNPTVPEFDSLLREPIRKFSDMKKGDHLVRHDSILGKRYVHHFICTGVDSYGRPTIIHYHNTPSNAGREFFTTGSFGSGSSGGKLASIIEITLPHKDFIKNESELQKKGVEVERVVWPEELRCYPDQEVIKRARGRLGEQDYDLGTNNCESFVMWCICGKNISFQSSKLSVRIALEVVKGFIMSSFQLAYNLPKVILETVEQVLGRSCLGNMIAREGIESLSLIGCTAGVVVSLVIDVACLVYGIWEATQKWRKGVLIKTREEFIEEVVGLVIKSWFRFVGSVAGMFIGQIFIPIPVVGAIVGILLGSGVGFGLGKFVSWSCSKRIASTLEKWYSSYHLNPGAYLVDGGVCRTLVMGVATFIHIWWKLDTT
jgi:hypothetical protein